MTWTMYVVPLCPYYNADDTNIFYKGNKMEDLVKIINGELENISVWLKNKQIVTEHTKDAFYYVSKRKIDDVHSGHNNW